MSSKIYAPKTTKHYLVVTRTHTCYLMLAITTKCYKNNDKYNNNKNNPEIKSKNEGEWYKKIKRIT